MTEAKVFAGICGFTTTIRVENLGKHQAKLIIETDCPNHKKVAKTLDTFTINAMDELFRKGKSQVMDACKGVIPHASCPVPAAILKALEVGVGLALPADVSVTFTKKEK